MRNPLNTIRPDIRAMHSYLVQDATGMVKLDAMENPHRLSIALQAKLGERLGAVALNRYPDGRVDYLRQVLAAHTGLPEGYGLLLGNGSDELISLLSIACDQPGAKVLAPLPGFVMYAMSAQLQGLEFVGVPLTADFELDLPAMLAAIDTHQPAIIYQAYPNNPTANLWDEAAIAEIIQAAPGLVVIDEAYQPFSSKSYLDVIRRDPARHSHVLLMRTLSKFGLAGVRLGYLVGPQALIAEVDKVRPPYNVSLLNCECALFALEHTEAFAAQAQDIRTQRAILFAALGVLPGVKVWPSEANMLLLRVPDAAKTFDAMKAQGVLVKNVSKMHSLLANCLRFTVGTAEENERLLAAFQKSL
ncbi:MAG: histidinol-phosphate transaminase [Burkholderiales bacterium]|nr:histidinol-phosphate transaminase [Burkholderiales bacterium]